MNTGCEPQLNKGSEARLLRHSVQRLEMTILLPFAVAIGVYR